MQAQGGEVKLSLLATKIRERKPPTLSMAPMIDCVFPAPDLFHGIDNLLADSGSPGAAAPTGGNRHPINRKV